MRNFDIPSESSDTSISSFENLGVRRSSQNLGNLSPEALNYIEELESDLASAKKVRTFLILWIYLLDHKCCIYLL